MSRLHVTAWLTAAVLAVLALHFHDQSVRADERAQHDRDSVIAANAPIKRAADSLLARHSADSASAVRRLALIAHQGAVVRASQGSLDSLRGILARIPDSLHSALDSLEALHTRRESTLQARGDSALALFRDAASRGDTLASLLRASQQEAAGLQMALIAARRKPLWDSTPVKVVQLALAVKGLASIFGH